MPVRDVRVNADDSSLRDVFRAGANPPLRVIAEADESIYASGEHDDSMYLIESGQVKVFMSSAEGKDCLIAVYTEGDLFGESCFTGSAKRFENAAAMQRTVVLRMHRRDFIAETKRKERVEALVKHLALRSAERQTAIFDLITLDSQKRLAKVLLTLSAKLGTPDGAFQRIDQRISQEDLAQIVGTTRPRVTAFMQEFRKLGIIDTPGPRSIRIHRQRARDYLGGD